MEFHNILKTLTQRLSGQSNLIRIQNFPKLMYSRRREIGLLWTKLFLITLNK
jgi:hypothetical protein